MAKEFHQIQWDRTAENELRDLVGRMLQEDLGDEGDCTSLALVPDNAPGRAAVVARQPGVIAGLKAAELVFARFDPAIRWKACSEDGAQVKVGQALAEVHGPAQRLLTAERSALNLLGRLSGVATLTGRYVDAVAGTGARIYDTRKTTPGLRRLEKYAVRCGGGFNHRLGLFEAILIKDNHLALGAQADSGRPRFTPAEAVEQARRYFSSKRTSADAGSSIVEIEVDTLEQLDEVLPAGPDIVLLDNMGPELLRQAVQRRDRINRSVELEASGGVNLDTIRAIAESGVDRISVGALTHSAVVLDVALDWIT